MRSASSKDRRSLPRRSLVLACAVFDPESCEEHRTRTVNVSAQGVLLHSMEKLPLGVHRRLSMRLQIPGTSRWVRAVGVVTRLEQGPRGSGATVGVHLLRMAEPDRLALMTSDSRVR